MQDYAASKCPVTGLGQRGIKIFHLVVFSQCFIVFCEYSGQEGRYKHNFRILYLLLSFTLAYSKGAFFGNFVRILPATYPHRLYRLSLSVVVITVT